MIGFHVICTGLEISERKFFVCQRQRKKSVLFMCNKFYYFYTSHIKNLYVNEEMKRIEDEEYSNDIGGCLDEDVYMANDIQDGILIHKTAQCSYWRIQRK